MREFVIKSTIYQYESVEELPEKEQELVRLAREYAQRAYAPYSGFRVGAALLLQNGKIITGNNQENAAYPSGCCAERTALFYASSVNPDSPVEVMAIAAINKYGEPIDDPIYPCGACRQVMIESEIRHGLDQRIIFTGKNKILAVASVKDILPLWFDNKFLYPGHV